MDKQINIFISYSHLDNKWFKSDKELFDLIPFLERSLVSRNVALWYDRHNKEGIEAGEKFKNRIISQIVKSDIAILLISQDFLNSRFIADVELPLIKDKYEKGELLVFPVLLEPCDWEEIEFISSLQLVPGKPTPLIDFTENEKDWKKVRYDLLRSLKNKIDKIQGKSSDIPPDKPSIQSAASGKRSFNYKHFILAGVAILLCLLFFTGVLDNILSPGKAPRTGKETSVQTIKIGNQEWMSNNLNVTSFRNGDSIREIKSDEEWKKAAESKIPGWCYYRNNRSNGQKSGVLYNWYAISDSRGIAPEGFHIPNKSEFDSLISIVGGEGETAYNSLIDGGSSGFNSLFGGARMDDGTFLLTNSVAYWSSSEGYRGSGGAFHLTIDKDKKFAKVMYYNNGMGFAVRCLKGEPVEENNPVNEYLDSGGTIDELAMNDGTKNIVIKDQVWMAENLNVSFFQNGDPISEARTNEEWKKAGENKVPAWCYFKDSPSDAKKYGRLYNWFAVTDKRGLAPKGFHIPTKNDFDKMLSNIGGEGREAYNRLIPGSSLNFNPIFYGSRDKDGNFILKKHTGFWSASKEALEGFAWSIIIDDNQMFAKPMLIYTNMGFSVRCLKDN